MATKASSPVIIDEIQRLPELLNEVHYLIEEHGIRFLLTGSSARKLRRGGANLLAGRALRKELFPLVTKEIGDYDILKIINYGALPAIYNSTIPKEELTAYVGTYLKEEIQAEGLVRRLDPFSRFLEIASLVNSELINFSNIASDLGVSSKTVKEYFLILEDTLVGHLLQPYQKTTKRKAVATPKFYFFDVGVANILGHRKNIDFKTEVFGKCLEHFIFTELRAYLSYTSDDRPLRFWRSRNRQEVDFMIGDDIAIEVKASERPTSRHYKGLLALSEEVDLKHKILVSLVDKPRKLDNGILILPYQYFLKELWADAYSI